MMIKAPLSCPTKLHGQVALVTGAARGIGQAVCLALAREGASIVAVDLIPMPETKRRVENLGIRCLTFPADVTNKVAIQELVEQTYKAFGRIDILNHCAGICHITKLPEITEEEWDNEFAVDVKGSFLITQAIFAKMKINNYGKIVLFGSVAGKAAGVAAGPHYSSAKGAVHTFTRWVAKYGAPFGIYANCIAPGPCTTEMTKDFPPESISSEKIPLGRLGTPEDIAEAAVFLSSPASNWITGVILDVNGGLFMG